ncbi:MAG: M50 family metallopeptidase [Christensenellaceae bacterium]|nr:M50 family metallopeptidase [Christensenellaceae bacterium]
MRLSFFGGRFRVNLLFLPLLYYLIRNFGIETILAFFLALFLHESGHMIAARLMDIRILSFELLPFGCAAHMESFAVVKGSKEILIAAAGPLMSLLFAAFPNLLIKESIFLNAAAAYSLSLAALNLLPVLPLDGGRILSCVLSQAMQPLRAAKICSVCGLVLSMSLFLFGIVSLFMGEFLPTLLIFSASAIYASILYLKNAAFSFIRQIEKKPREFAKRPLIGVRHIAALQGTAPEEILTHFSTRDLNLVHIVGKDMKLQKTLSEGEILEKLYQ